MNAYMDVLDKLNKNANKKERNRVIITGLAQYTCMVDINDVINVWNNTMYSYAGWCS